MPPPVDRDAALTDDELLALREENKTLKKFNHEQSDKVKRLGVQMDHIKMQLLFRQPGDEEVYHNGV